MSIEGYRITGLGTNGGPGAPMGPLSYEFMTPLEFPLQIAGPSSARLDSPEEFQSAQQKDVGVQLIVQALDAEGNELNVRGGTLKIRLMLPDGTTVEKAAEVLTNGTDGKFFYTTTVDDLAQPGYYGIQGLIDKDSAPKATRLGSFRVEGNIAPPGP